jgi:hypothetical protein
VASISVPVNENHSDLVATYSTSLFWVLSEFATSHENNYFELGVKIRLPPDIHTLLYETMPFSDLSTVDPVPM